MYDKSSGQILIWRNGVLITLDPELPDKKDVQETIETYTTNHENDDNK